MIKKLSFLIVVAAVLPFQEPLTAQETLPVSKKELRTLIDKVVDSLAYYYVDYEEGKHIGAYLKKQEAAGKYKGIKNPDSLAKALTKSLRSLNGDLHLSVWKQPINNGKEGDEKVIDKYTKAMNTNYGLEEVTVLPENIGYLKVASFSNWDFFEETKKVIDAAMKFLENTDALIVDVRGNRGGVPNLVAYLSGYLFDGKPVHMSQYYHRYRDSGYGLYTETDTPGKKLPDIPVFVLTDSGSASAAEEFAYFIKHSKRGLVVGDTTMGAGYGAMSHRLNNRFFISISSEEDINPYTKTNFEGVGVIPNVPMEGADALIKAKSLAIIAGKKYHEQKKAFRNDLEEALRNFSKETPASEITSTIKKSHAAGILNERAINNFGYQCMGQGQKAQIAEVVFRTNTELYPTAPNTYDSYAEALVANGKLVEAAVQYEKAILLAEEKGDSDLALFRANLEKMKAKLPK